MKKLLLLVPVLIFGAILFIGMLFRIMHWPGGTYLPVFGAIGVLAGILVFVVLNKKIK